MSRTCVLLASVIIVVCPKDMGSEALQPDALSCNWAPKRAGVRA